MQMQRFIARQGCLEINLLPSIEDLKGDWIWKLAVDDYRGTKWHLMAGWGKYKSPNRSQ